MTPDQKAKLRADIHRVVSILPIETLALGYIRYEKLRRLNRQQYAKLNRTTRTTYERFDDLVDQLEDSEL
jgi:hypothetical protein